MLKILVSSIFFTYLRQILAVIPPLMEYKLNNWSRIVPEILNEVPKNVEMCRVTYPSGVEVNLGNYLSPYEVREAPTVTWTANSSDYYYLIFEGIDVPSWQYHTMRESFYWMVGNIPGNNVTAGETVFEYLPPSGSHSSGLHRYLFLVYKQDKIYEFKTFVENLGGKRNPLSVQTLQGITFPAQGPVAVNFYNYRVYPSHFENVPDTRSVNSRKIPIDSSTVIPTANPSNMSENGTEIHAENSTAKQTDNKDPTITH